MIDKSEISQNKDLQDSIIFNGADAVGKEIEPIVEVDDILKKKNKKHHKGIRSKKKERQTEELKGGRYGCKTR